MNEQKIARINELYRKSKAEGLTDLRSQLNQIDIEEKDGSITNLGAKYGTKKGH